MNDVYYAMLGAQHTINVMWIKRDDSFTFCYSIIERITFSSW